MPIAGKPCKLNRYNPKRKPTIPETYIRTDIQRALRNFTNGNLAENATHLLKVLGYESQRTLNRNTNTLEAFFEDFNNHERMNREKALLHEWQTADFLFYCKAHN